MTATPLDLEALRRAVAESLGVQPASIADDEDLLHLGLDSIQVIRLASRWRRAGAEVTFAELIEYRTLVEWWKLVDAKLAESREGAAAVPGATVFLDTSRPRAAVGESRPFDLATMQHAYWVGRDPEQVLGGVGAQFYCEFDGVDVDPARLGTAVHALVTRHGMLRARFLDDGRQEVLADSPWPGLTVHDLREASQEPAEQRLLQIRDELSHRRMAAEQGQVFDVVLALLPEGATRLHIAIEMLVSDAQSFQILLDDLAHLYTRPAAPLPPIDYHFAQYLADKADRHVERREKDGAWWRDRLPELPGAPELPLAVEPARHERHGNVRRTHAVSAEDWKRLTEAAREESVLLSMVFVTAFAEVIGAWSGAKRFLLNLPFYDRDELHPDVGRIVGDFTNLVLLAVDVSEEKPFVERVRDVQSRFHRDLAHASFTGVDVLRELARSRSSLEPLAPVVFTTAINLGELFGEAFRDSFGTPGWTMSTTPQVWLDCQVTERGGGLFVNWDVVDGLFAPGVVDGMFEAYVAVLDRLVRGDWSASATGLVPASSSAVRAEVNATGGERPRGLLHEGFFSWAGREPSRVALVGSSAEDGSLAEVSFGGLASRALRVAGWLAERGVVPGEPVGVWVPRGVDQVVAVLGVLAAGAVYVPVGVQQPELRRARILESAGARLVLTVEEIRASAGAVPLTSPVPVDASQSAYVIYTSGSTGEPKGVEITHEAALNTVADISERFGIGCVDRVLALSSLDFDLSVYDIFGLLGAGGAMVLIADEETREASSWVDLVRRAGVTVWNSVPALLEMGLAAGADRPGWADGLRVVLVSGDWVAVDLGERLRAQAPSCRLIAMGGATEAAIWSNAYEVDGPIPEDWKSVPYGRPLRNQMFRVVDEWGRDCPDWVPGELWIGGAGVALGYRNDPVRTAAQFLTDEAGVRWYRTGDLGRYRPDGLLEFLGRRDFQVKIRGHRIELGEVEAALLGFAGVAQAVAVVTGTASGGRLAAAVVGGEVDAEALKSWCRDRLPAYMVPDSVTVVSEFPLSANGKVDRTALAGELAEGIGPERADAPLPGVETQVAELWAELLQTPSIHRQDNFFTLGGDSLLATRLIARLRSAGYADIRLRALLATPVLADFAAMLRPGTDTAAGSGDAAATSTLVLDPEHAFEPFPPTDVQRAYWVGRTDRFALGGVGSHWYWELDGAGVDVGRLEDAWNTLIRRHGMLRAVFDDDGDQRVLPEVPRARIPMADAPADAPETALAALRDELSHRIADPAAWPLVVIRGVRYGDRTRLAFSFDYMVLDALSIVLVFHELRTLYLDPEAVLPPVELTFRDYLLGAGPDEHEREVAEEYWRARAAELPPAPRLPLAKDPEQITAPRFVRLEHALGPERWARLTARARDHGLTPAAVLATAYAEVLGAWSEDDSLTVNMTLFDRRDVHSQVGRVLGDFTSLLVAGYEPGPGETFVDAVRRYQQRIWDDMEHRAVSALWVLRERSRRLGSADVAMPVVFTSALGLPPDLVDLDLPFGSPGWGLSQTPQVWLDCQVTERDGGLSVNWDVVAELFPEGVVEAMFEAYAGLLDRLADGGWDSAVDGLLPGRSRAVRSVANATEAPAPPGLLHDGFFAWALREPSRVALVSAGADGAGLSEVSFAGLASRALRVAGWLAERGVVPGEPVGVCVPRGVDQVVAVLGVLAAGGVYVPVGVQQPELRRTRILESAGARLMVTAQEVADSTSSDPLSSPVPVDASQLAYVIYTSGSTGEPKGVEITHETALNTVADISERFGIGSADRVLALSSLDFDLSVYDIFGLLGAGGAMVLIADEDAREAAGWVELVERAGVTVWNSVPALLEMGLAAGADRPGWADGLRVVLVSGDWVAVDLGERLRAQAPSCRLIAMGGATEAAIWSNAYEVVDGLPDGWRSVPYGKPLRNQVFRVVDGRGRDCPDWVPGELWIGGAGVALGYRNDPVRTAAQFLTDEAGVRWYRTGDLGRYRPDGLLEFLGRRDFQVKIRGHRIELGEVEAALLGFAGVGQAVAVVAQTAAGGRLTAAVVGVDALGADPDVAAMTAWCRDRLPAYMVPDSIAVVSEFPLSANGKVDRTALAHFLVADTATQSTEPPLPGTETRVADLWAELLGVPEIRRHDNFFTLGGDSLLATRLVAEIRRVHGVPMSLRALLAVPTVAELAALVDAETASQDPDSFEEGVI